MTANTANVRIINELKESRRVLHEKGLDSEPRTLLLILGGWRRVKAKKRMDDAFLQGGEDVASWSIGGGFQLRARLNYACLWRRSALRNWKVEGRRMFSTAGLGPLFLRSAREPPHRHLQLLTLTDWICGFNKNTADFQGSSILSCRSQSSSEEDITRCCTISVAACSVFFLFLSFSPPPSLR